MELKMKELEKQFYADGYRIGMEAVKAGAGKTELNNAVKQLHKLVDSMIEILLSFAESQGQVPDCKKGCSWCCYQPVYLSGYELEFLNSYLSEHFNEDDMRKIASRAAIKRDKLKNLQGASMLNSKAACPLLDNGVCSVYEVRPVACRIYLSSRVNSCQQFFHNPEGQDSIPALLNFPLRTGRVINQGFQAALKVNGFAVEEYRIEERLLET